MNLSVIISTYNNPRALQKCLWGYACQSRTDFEVLIADDGSTAETGEMISRFARQMPVPIAHLWQEHRGFGKSRILNRAIQRAQGEYLIFTDGDCIPRRDFVEAHAAHARPNYFLAGGSHIRIPEPLHLAFQRADIEHQCVFSPRWLRARGLPFRAKRLFRLTQNRTLAAILNLLTPRSGSFIGCNASAWKRDVEAINGFDEDYTTYGTEDKDFGLRLTYQGVRSRRLKYSLICLHLDHPRPYTEAEICDSFRRLRQTKRQRAVVAAHGLRPPLTAPAACS
jgi:glycosyltransferase involved in cell wall biosynthesis